MQIAYVDTSIVVALALGEPAGVALRPVIEALDEVCSSALLEAEFLATLAREAVGDEPSHYLAPISWIFPRRRLSAEYKRALRQGHLRGADVHHVATALYVFPEPRGTLFVTLDQRQQQVAAALGFRTVP
ncbi:MAG: PIN domain-containing protein [Myxococcales bacterium]|nr:PIN domain-containing protein [Myxococcales bacterium]